MPNTRDYLDSPHDVMPPTNRIDSAHPWHPHIMFFAPRADKPTWGENLPGSPVQADCTNAAETCIFMVRVAK